MTEHQGIEGRVAMSPEQKRSQRRRSLAIALGLVALAVLFYLVTIFQLGGHVANRPL